MGRKRNRKRERMVNQRHQNAPVLLPDFAPSFEDLVDDDDYLLALEMRRTHLSAPPTTNCGSCQEFVEDQEGGRGTCLHPGSGILSPWTDTPGCPFHARRRGR